MPEYMVLVCSPEWEIPDVQFADTYQALIVVVEDARDCGYCVEVYSREKIRDPDDGHVQCFTYVEFDYDA